MKVVKVVKKNDAGEWFGFHPGDYVKLARTTKGYSMLGDPLVIEPNEVLKIVRESVMPRGIEVRDSDGSRFFLRKESLKGAKLVKSSWL